MWFWRRGVVVGLKGYVAKEGGNARWLAFLMVREQGRYAIVAQLVGSSKDEVGAETKAVHTLRKMGLRVARYVRWEQEEWR